MAAQGGERVRVGVVFKEPVTASDEARLRNAGASIIYRYRLIRAVDIEVPEQALDGIRNEPPAGVVAVGRPSPPIVSLSDEKGWEKLAPKFGHGFDSPAVNPQSGVRMVVAGTGIECGSLDIDCTGGETFNGHPWDEDGHPPNGHETGVASIIFGKHNGEGRFGWAVGGWLYSGRVIPGTCVEVAQMIDWAAVDIGALVVNMSFSIPFYPDFETDCPQLGLAVDSAAHNYGVLLIASSGNISTHENRGAQYPDSVAYPARYDNVMAVGGVWCGSDNGFGCAFKARWWEDSAFGSQMDIVASAHNVRLLEAEISLAIPTYKSSGTSFAAPMVSAAAALVIAEYPQCFRQPNPVRAHLKEHAYTPAFGPTDWTHVGSGVLDVAAALENEPGCLLGGP